MGIGWLIFLAVLVVLAVVLVVASRVIVRGER